MYWHNRSLKHCLDFQPLTKIARSFVCSYGKLVDSEALL
jgi:hypothetical protein